MASHSISRWPASLMPDIADLWTTALAPLTEWNPAHRAHLIRVEDTVEDGRYVVRAEIPGIDPGKDVEVNVHDGYLTIRAERSEKHEEKGRSEFNYGSFSRTVALPADADDEGIVADYTKGILTVRVPLNEQPKELTKKIPVQSGD